MSFVRGRILQKLPLLPTRCTRGEDNLILFQCVRWRQRRWAPKSLTKQYYVRERTPLDPADRLEITTLYNHYNTTMRAIRRLLMTQQLEKREESHDASVMDRQQQVIEEVLEANDRWNLESAARRAGREAQEVAESQSRELQGLVELEAQETERLRKAEKLVQAEAELAHTFITSDGLDAAIEAALDTVNTYNFVLDRDGTVQTEGSDGGLTRDSLDTQIQELERRTGGAAAGGE